MTKQTKQTVIGTRLTPELKHKIDAIREIYRKTSKFKGPELSNSYIIETAISMFYEEMLMLHVIELGEPYPGDEIAVAKPANEPELPIDWQSTEYQNKAHETMQSIADGLNEQPPVASVKVQKPKPQPKGKKPTNEKPI